GAFYLPRVEHLGPPVDHVAAGEGGDAVGHEIGHGAPVADAFQDLRGDERHGLGVVELEAARAATAGDLGGHEHAELVLLSRGQTHATASRASYTVRCWRTAS